MGFEWSQWVDMVSGIHVGEVECQIDCLKHRFLDFWQNVSRATVSTGWLAGDLFWIHKCFSKTTQASSGATEYSYSPKRVWPKHNGYECGGGETKIQGCLTVQGCADKCGKNGDHFFDISRSSNEVRRRRAYRRRSSYGCSTGGGACFCVSERTCKPASNRNYNAYHILIKKKRSGPVFGR